MLLTYISLGHKHKRYSYSSSKFDTPKKIFIYSWKHGLLKTYQDTPYCCNARRINVLSPVKRTPHHIGILKSIFNAKAVPITANSKKQSLSINKFNENEILIR